MTSNWFIAWPAAIPAEWLAALEAGAPGGLRFTMPADLHLTLAFLGKRDPGLLDKMAAFLRGLPFPNIEITLGRVIALPRERRFSTLAFELIRGRPDVEKQIAKWRDRLCREAGAKLDTRAPVPHVTIARPQRTIGPADRAEVIEWIATITPPAAPIYLKRPVIYLRAADDSERQFDRHEP
jgi:2'-5' RNA ligase